MFVYTLVRVLIWVVQKMMVEPWVEEGLDGGFVTVPQALQRALEKPPRQSRIIF